MAIFLMKIDIVKKKLCHLRIILIYLLKMVINGCHCYTIRLGGMTIALYMVNPRGTRGLLVFLPGKNTILKR